MRTLEHASPLALLCILSVQFVALWNTTSLLSPTRDEPANMAAGLEYWESGSSQRYNVNPPLVKLWATIPLRFIFKIHTPELPPSLRPGTSHRYEFHLGNRLAEMLGEHFQEHLVSARRMCLMFAVIGTVGVFALVGLWFSDNCAVWAAALWAFNPICLGYGSLVSCDIPAASMGCWVIYSGMVAYRHPSLSTLLMAGGMLGLALLVKLTWVLAFPIIILVAITLRASACEWNFRTAWPSILRLLPGVTLIFASAWLVLIAGYRCEGLFRPLGDYEFVSNLLTDHAGHGNRFSSSWFAKAPVPIPAPMLMGMDQQWQDFDKPQKCFLMGTWKNGGWYYYYAVALLVKLPLGLILMLAIAAFKLKQHLEASLVCMAVVLPIFVLTSLKTNMNEHTRYLWIVLPQLITLAMIAFEQASPPARWGVRLLMLWSLGAGAASFPCGISYFNELAGGASQGDRVLAGCNIDWGHGWLAARNWLDRQPRSNHVAVLSRENLISAGIHTTTDAPRDITDPLETITVLMGIDERQLLQRSHAYPNQQQVDAAQRIGCCVEAYEIPLSEFNKIRNCKWIAP
jgi:4-amino-4-deoxy-L-arabinose transferase-like glycosyltransferase